MPLLQLIKELGKQSLNTLPINRLLESNTVGDELVQSLDTFSRQHSDSLSLSQISYAKVEHFKKKKYPLRSLMVFPVAQAFSVFFAQRKYKDLIQISNTYANLILVAQTGPLNESIDTNVVDEFFEKYLEQFFPPYIAHQYNNSLEGNTIGICTPPEFNNLGAGDMSNMEIWSKSFYMIDADTCRKHWEHLQEIPDVWGKLETTLTNVLNSSRYAQKTTTHLRQIGEIAKYALQHNLSMYKGFV